MTTIAARLEPVLHALLGEVPVPIRFWDESTLGREGSDALIVRSPNALTRLLFAPNELGVGRAYVAGELDIEGDIYRLISALRAALERRSADARVQLGARDRVRVLRAARSVGALGLPPPRPAEEARLTGRLHSRTRDAAAISHHYDVGNDFYRIVLGETMTYSCAYFASPDVSLDDAQRAKYELICRKLGLEPGMRLLDVGCGWGGMALHAARHHGVRCVGITLSNPQADLAAKRVAETGVADRVEIRVQDYRDVSDGPFDAISSIGMFEHVGLARLKEYFGNLFALLRPGGRLLNHAISKPPGSPRIDRNSFIGRYVFPDGELHEVGSVVSAMQSHGLEVRDVESLREHYALTLRRWVANLEGSWDEAVSLAGAPRTRIWRLYMAGAALNFEAGRTNIHQVLGVVGHPDGRAEMPLARPGWSQGL